MLLILKYKIIEKHGLKIWFLKYFDIYL